MATAKMEFSTFYNVIQGRLTIGSAVRHGINPATREPNPPVPVATLQDVDAAVAAAKEAFKLWSKTTISERRRKIVAFAEALSHYSDDFATLLTTEQGRPVSWSSMYRDAAINSIIVRLCKAGGNGK